MLNFPIPELSKNEFKNFRLNIALFNLLFDIFVTLTWNIPNWMRILFIIFIFVDAIRLSFLTFSEDYLSLERKDYTEK